MYFYSSSFLLFLEGRERERVKSAYGEGCGALSHESRTNDDGNEDEDDLGVYDDVCKLGGGFEDGVKRGGEDKL